MSGPAVLEAFRPAAPADITTKKRASGRGVDKALGAALFGRSGVSAAWFFDGEWWWNCADVRVCVCGVKQGAPVAFTVPGFGVLVGCPESKVPRSVPGWLDIGPLTALELAGRLGVVLEVAPTRARATSSASRPKPAATPAAVPAPVVPAPATYAGVLSMLARICEGAGELEQAALMRAADVLEEAMAAQRGGR